MFSLEFNPVYAEDVSVSWNAGPPCGAFGINAGDVDGIFYTGDVVVSHPDIATDDFACVGFGGFVFAFFAGRRVVCVGVCERVVEELD